MSRHLVTHFVDVFLWQRNVAESQTPSGYSLLNSPLAGGGQISPGQRIPQPPFSPHGQTPSPLSNQQYSNRYVRCIWLN